ncbi:MAG: DUF4437 domain-containing protein [Myxococcota bacterium]
MEIRTRTRVQRPALVLAFLVGCGSTAPRVAEGPAASPSPVTVLAYEDVAFTALNPARGDASPMAGTIWGDRNGTAPTAFLFHPVDGFSSPPHIHNVSYRAIVIRGLVHNAHPDAEEQWMPAGSFWTQPQGAVHITAARGEDILALVEIDEGPYLVRPVDQAYETGERAVNVDADAIPWTVRERTQLRFAELWGEPFSDAPGGMLVEVPSGLEASSTSTSPLRAVLVAGTIDHLGTMLVAGSSLFAEAAPISVACTSDVACVLYLRSRGALSID